MSHGTALLMSSPRPCHLHAYLIHHSLPLSSGSLEWFVVVVLFVFIFPNVNTVSLEPYRMLSSQSMHFLVHQQSAFTQMCLGDYFDNRKASLETLL